MDAINQANQGPGADNPGAAQVQGKEGPADFLAALSQPSEAGSQSGAVGAGGTEPPAAADPGNGNATKIELPGFAQAATKELKSDPKFMTWASKFKSFDDAVKAAMELESKLGSVGAVPGENASPEEKAAFELEQDRKRGVPEKPEEYKLERVEGIEYDETADGEFRELAKKLRLTQEQAAGIFEYAGQKSLAIQQSIAEQEAQAKAAKVEEYKSTEAAFRKEWGADFDKNLEITKRGFSTFVPPEFSQRIQKAGLGNDPDFLKLVYALGRTVQESPGVNGKGYMVGADGKPQLEYPGL